MSQDIRARTFRSQAADAAANLQIQTLLHEAAAESDAGNHYKAAAAFFRILEIDPKQTSALTGIAAAMRRQGNLAGSTEAYRKAIAASPGAAGNHFGLAEVLRRRGKFTEALQACANGFAIDPSVGEGHIVRSQIWKNLGEGDKAIEDLRSVALKNPSLASIQILFSETLTRFGRADEAIDHLQNAAAGIANDPALLRQLYKLLSAQSRTGEAIAVWEKIPEVLSNDAEAYRSLATLYQEQGRIQEAFEAYQKALDIDPKFVRAYMNLAGLMNSDNRFDLATAIYRFVAALSPDDAIAHHNLGRSLRLEGKWEEASKENKRTLELDPDFVQAHVEASVIAQFTCDWDNLGPCLERLQAFDGRTDSAIPPFTYIIAPGTNRDLQLSAGRSWAKYKQGLVVTGKPFAPRPVRHDHGRIKVGYLSSDFHTHATAMLMVEMLELHDRNHFDVYAYSFGPDDRSGLRRRIVNAFDTFREFRAISNSEAARRIYADEIDILIDLKGYTQDSRTEVFAARPAPVQVNYLGYPATMAAGFIDYIVADPIVIPDAHAASYTEKIVRLPHCYQPNDRKRPIAALNITRATYNLPEDGFVFCCFNNPYKILDFMFDIWMDLLRDLPGSVLWLFSPSPSAGINLKQHAAARGIDPSRLVFAPHQHNDIHLARLGLADLFLDTLPYNAHTTTSDALWAGVPVVTCCGDTFAGRVASSLLDAIGLPELVTDSLGAYKAKVLELARNRVALAGLRKKLAANRLTTPLFDSSLYVKHFESALTRMFERHKAGHSPAAFDVPPLC